MSHSDPHSWSSIPWSSTIEPIVDEASEVTDYPSMNQDDLSLSGRLSHYQGIERQPTATSLVDDYPLGNGRENSQPGGWEDMSTSFLPSSSSSNVIFQANSLFSGAHDFIVRDSIMVSNEIKQDIEGEMIKLLKKKALVDATYDSAARHGIAPQCHPETRVPLREKIISWLLNMDRGESLFWLYGPAGVGKSAIAQSLMEYCAQHGFPGAGLFLSRARKRNDPNRIIPSLVHQLAIAHPAYRRTITDLLSADSTILEKRLPIQFQQLIDKPADVFTLASDSDHPSYPILLLLDGLDECNTESAQCELIRLIASFASTCKIRRLPFVCIITSRPEWQIVSSFNQLGSNFNVWRKELPMDTLEAVLDVEKVLYAGFKRIRDRRDDAYAGDTEWPGQARFRTIKFAASGNMLFASIVVDFIDDEDPNARLELCLKWLQGKLTSGKTPLDPLSALYEGMLRSIPSDLLHDTLRILFLHILNEDGLRLTAQTSANFFRIDRPKFYACLRKLRSVLKVPLHSDAGRHCLEFSHTTFADYLKVAIQTGTFGLYEAEAIEDIRTRCIHWHNIFRGNRDEEALSSIVPWPENGNTVGIFEFSRLFLFKLWGDLFHQGDFVKLREELRHFVFKDLPRVLFCSDGEPLRNLVENLIDYQNKNKSSMEDCVVRATPVCPTDHRLLEKHRSLVGQWGASVQGFEPATGDHDLRFILYSLDDPFDDLVAARLVSAIQWCPSLAYILLGHGQNVILAIVFPMETEQRVYWQGAFERIKTAHTNSSTLDNSVPPNDCEQALLRFYAHLSRGMRRCSEDNKQARMVEMRSLECILVSFIADAKSNPLARLEVVTNILSVTRELLKIVHLLCQYTLRNIPHEIQAVAHRILAFLLAPYSDHIVHSRDLAEMLHLDHMTIRQVIRWLHPFVFSWSPPSNPEIVYLGMRLPCYDLQHNYIDFEVRWKWLRHHPYFHLEEQAWQDAFVLWIQFGSSFLRTGYHPLSRSETDKWAFLEYASRVLHSIHTDNGLATAVAELCNFPFCHWGLTEDERDYPAAGFLLGLKVLVHQLSKLACMIGPVIRNQPVHEVDHLLLEKWRRMGQGFEFAKFPLSEKTRWKTTFYLVSLRASTIMPSVRRAYHIFLLGEGHNTCLIAMST